MKSDRPIDAMIAEHVMQTEKYWAIRWGGSGYGDFPTYDQAVIHAMKLFGDRRAAIIPYWDEPHYSTDIAAAWQVVEKLTGTHIISVAYMLNKKWRCEIIEVRSGPQKPNNGFADTAPLAICLAALQAVGMEVEE